MAEAGPTIWDWVNHYQGALLVVLASVAAGFAYFQLRVTREIRKRELEDIYVQRFWSLFDQLSRDGRAHVDLGQPLPERKKFDSDRAVLRRYLELCEDQADMREAGYVTSQTWNLWWPAIHSAISRSPTAEVMERWLEDVRIAGLAKPPLVQLREGQRVGPDFDPAGRVARFKARLRRKR